MLNQLNPSQYGLNQSSKLTLRKSIRGLGIASALLVALTASQVQAQTEGVVQERYPELATLFNAFDVTQLNAYERIAEINADPSTSSAQRQLKMQLTMMANMTMSEMMAAGMGHGGMTMSMSSPYGDLEVNARMALLEQMRQRYSDAEVASVRENNTVLDVHTTEILRRGHAFEEQLLAIYVDDSISDKRAAVAAAIEEYLSDEQHSVAATPRESEYLLDHDQATGLKSAFPLISGFLWTQQWMQLAALEAVILEHVDDQVSGGVDTVLERFWNKIGSSGGMSMFPAPSELPMAPAIAPDLYSQSPEAAIILDNLHLFENVIADIIAYPDMVEPESAFAAAAEVFTGKEASAESVDYLLFALRSGIYDQGGPAVGELMQSERNRSRAAMDMQHTMIMSSPQ